MKLFPMLLLICIAVFKTKAQIHIATDSILLVSVSKTQLTPLASDSLCSSFFIVIPGEVKLHYHASHTENVIVMEGTGIMKLGENDIKIKKGDLIVIPKGTKHAVKNTGEIPLKVISVQSPYFDGKDRVFVD